MGKIKEQIKSLIGEQKYFLKRYCLTFIIIAFVTLAMVFIGFDEKYVEEFYSFFILADILIFSIESFVDFKWQRIPLYILGVIVAIITKEFIFSKDITTKQGIFIAGIYAFISIVAIYRIIKSSKVSISHYLIKVANNFILFGIANIVIQIGIFFILAIIDTLLLKNSSSNLYLNTEILLLGFFTIPISILCLLNVKKDVLKPMEILVCYITLPIVLIAEIIIYLYFIKIIAIREIPSNSIFSIITALYTCAFPIWIVIDKFKEKNIYIEKSDKYLPYSFIPLICMQIYCVGIRIAEVRNYSSKIRRCYINYI